MENRRRQSNLLGFALLAVLLILFGAILYALVVGKPEASTETLLGGWGATVLTMIGVIVSFEFGSSKGSQLKDQASQARNNPPPAAPAPNPEGPQP